MRGLNLTSPPVPCGGRYVAGKIYPTGEGVLYPRPRPKKPKTAEVDPIRSEYEQREEHWEENSALFGVQRSCAQLLAESVLNANLQETGVSRDGGSLESTSAAISHSPRSRKGSRGLGTSVARVLRYSASTIERRAGSPTNLSFLTLTLPSMSDDAWERVLRGWGDILRTFTQWLKRRLISKGLPGHVVGCVELQTKRAHRTGEPGLHIHAVFQGRHRHRSWAVTPVQCREAWKRSVSKYAKESLDFSNCENLTQVRKSASRYLAKYLSKGGNQWHSLVSPRFQSLHPASWAFTPDCLKKLFHQSTWVGDEAVAVLTLAIYNPTYRHGEVIEKPIYELPNGQWVKVSLIRLERSFAASLDSRWSCQ